MQSLIGTEQMQGRKRARKGETKGMKKKGRRSGDEDADIPIASGSPTSCCTSDSDSQECADADARPKTTSRAARGAATEPQSIYARVLQFILLIFCGASVLLVTES
jgi:hypothetical protein